MQISSINLIVDPSKFKKHGFLQASPWVLSAKTIGDPTKLKTLLVPKTGRPMDSVHSYRFRARTGRIVPKGNARTRKRRITIKSSSSDQVMRHYGFRMRERSTYPSDITESNSYDSNSDENEEKEENRIEEYLPLYIAALNGDWESAKRILENDPDALTAKITLISKTLLQVAVSTGHDIQFIEKLLDFMPAESVVFTDNNGSTALSSAAIVGNTEAAKLLVKKNSDLTQMRNKSNHTALHHAAIYGHKETVCYLLSVTRDEESSPFTGESGVKLLNSLIIAGFYDIALELLKHYPKLALDEDDEKDTALNIFAQYPKAFASGSQLGYWQHIIYHCISVEMDNVSWPLKPMEGGDVENPTESSETCSTKSTHHRFLQQISTAFGTLCEKVPVILWIAIKQLVPSISRIYDAKLMHKQTHELVKRMCAEVMTSSGANARNLLKTPFFTATRLGILEFVTEIIKTYPHSIWFMDGDERDVFQLAILYRHQKNFSLLYQLGWHKQYVATFMDKFRNNLLHSAGTLKPSTRVSGAALQMQREWQWFKEVEKVVKPSDKEMQNSEGKTPSMVFTKEHENLVKKGEKWMKETATSCTLVASLIATVVFAAAFTVPGGNDSNQGIPIFLHESSFMVFVISDAISLFSSTTSLLMFLGILTSRYSEEDFFESLPKKLIIGLITLFISIASMVIAFSATLYIVLVHRLKNWVVIPIALLACLPMTLFPLLQFPLLVELGLSTYGPSIFRRQRI